ncbi:MAG TPA: hypothetical protein VHQ94_09600 [Pyrinomonadaceae bacterium]|jgi:hypothetical protein|nr:hypothetical protein [Pyrinomonadaceae bacterium]
MKSVSSVFSDGGHRFTIDLVDEFLAHRTYQHAFCLKLFELGKNPSVSWEVRRLATLMAEHQILKLQPDQLNEFDGVLCELRLKRRGLQHPIAASVLREGYSTTEFRAFVVEFLRRLARNDRVHRRVDGVRSGLRKKASEDAVREFIEHSGRDCKLTLARYLFTPDDVIREVLRHVIVTDGVRDVDVSQPRFIDAEIKHNVAMLPEYEAGILRRLCAGSKVYWVAPGTSSAINSLVEYPLSTVVLVIKPPGSEVEFELKRAGRKGANALGVVFKRNGRNVPSSHRLDGGSMQWLLRYEARSGSKMSSIFRLVHRVDAPLPGYIARNTVYSIPTRNGTLGSAPAFRYFTEPHVFGDGRFPAMRAAMKEAVKVYERDEGENLPAVGGDMGMTAEFLSHVAPAQSILCGTSSFRIDKVAGYLSSEGAEKYFREYQELSYSADEARRFADELLDEVLGVYVPPSGAFKSYGRYVDSAFAMPVNRERANKIFLSLVRQIAELWGTVMGIRGQSRGESFVGRNVGLRSVWVDGRWRVKLIFMDHDALTLPDDEIGHFFAQNALPGMLLDERHIWGKANPALFPTSLVGYLIGIYRIDAALAAEAQSIAETELRAAYKKTQHAVMTDRKLRAFVSDVFVSRLLDWDNFAAGYLRGDHHRSAWKKEMKRMFAAKDYEADAFDYYTEACDKYRGFLERNAFLYMQ